MYDVKIFLIIHSLNAFYVYSHIHTRVEFFLLFFILENSFSLSFPFFRVWLIALVLNKNFIFHSASSFSFCLVPPSMKMRSINIYWNWSLYEEKFLWMKMSNVNYESSWNLISLAQICVGAELSSDNLFYYIYLHFLLPHFIKMCSKMLNVDCF